VANEGTVPLQDHFRPPLSVRRHWHAFHNAWSTIQLVSPANKDRPEHRDAFLSKCAAYLQQGVGLLVVDVVTGRGGRLYEELLARLSPSATPADSGDLYAVAYRSVERDDQPSLDIWQEPVTVGQPLPTLPLWLRGGHVLPVDLERTYQRTCREQRIPGA
jgi:hypothetical protein